MIRHHALMLAAATTWLGPQATRAWTTVHASAARGFLRRNAHQPLWRAIETAEQGLTGLLLDGRSRQPAGRALAWLEADADAGSRYVDYLAAASLGVMAVLEAPQVSGVAEDTWLAHAVAELHSDPEFNRDWIEDCARRLLTTAATGV
jgi:hypothetical protein